MSKNPLIGKFLLILAVVGAAFAFGFPPKDRINLGLDLKGGAHILMAVDTQSAVDHQIGVVQTYLSRKLDDAGLTYSSVSKAEGASILILGLDAAQATDTRSAVRDVVGATWDVASSGKDGLRLTMPFDEQEYHARSAVDVSIDTMRNRIDSLGVAERTIQKQGLEGDRILVQLPGVENSERVKSVLSDRGLLEWKEVVYPPGVTNFDGWGAPDSKEGLLALFGGALPPGAEVLEQRGIGDAGSVLYWPLREVAAISGSDLRNAYRSSGQWGDANVAFQLTADAGKRFEVATKENLGKRMAIVVEDHVISVPRINGVIRDSGVIEGGFTVQSAEDLALKLKSGANPAKITIIEERTVGPSLGRDSIRRGLTAGLIGFAAVLVFMVVYYRLSGVNAVVALSLNVVLVFGVLGALPILFGGVSDVRATLTLPGIAGLILTVGMAVDANVLIFERIREELRLGKTVRSAVEQGFGKAFTTILDCNVTTVVAAVFLAMYGTGPVRGFAVTLVIGLAASMFTAIYVSRQLFELVLSRKQRTESLSI